MSTTDKLTNYTFEDLILNFNCEHKIFMLECFNKNTAFLQIINNIWKIVVEYVSLNIYRDCCIYRCKIKTYIGLEVETSPFTPSLLIYISIALSFFINFHLSWLRAWIPLECWGNVFLISLWDVANLDISKLGKSIIHQALSLKSFVRENVN